MVAVELDERRVPQASDAVTRLIVRIVARQNPEFGSGFGEQQHDDSVEVAQALARQAARIDPGPGALLAVADVLDDGVGEDLDAPSDAVTQLLGDAGGFGCGSLQQSRE